jgi:membrane protein implicated in regulation of membrane protease activity
LTFLSWLVFGVIFIFSEFATGTYYLLAIGLAFVYPSVAAYVGASSGMQMIVLGAGALVHALIVMMVRKRIASATPSDSSDDIGQRVEVIEWIDESSARVRYRGVEWDADKVRAEMPNSSFGTIQSIQGTHLIISTAG